MPLICPLNARIIREIKVPRTKVPAKVPRVRLGSKRFMISAMGGPPIEVEVPRMPEATPAMSVLAVVGRGLHPKLDSVIARSTAQPIKMDSPSGERLAIAQAPTREPGMRAREEMPTTRQDVSR